MKKRICSLIVIMAIFFLPQIVFSAVYIWDGSTDTDWATAANWTRLGGGTGVPGSSDNANIDSVGPAANQPTSSSGSVTVSTLNVGGTVDDGGTLTLGGSFVAVHINVKTNGTLTAGAQTINLTGNWNNTSSAGFTHSGLVNFTGGASNLTSASRAFNDININQVVTATPFTPKDAMNVDGDLTLTKCTFDASDSNPNINIAGSFVITANSAFTKGTGVITFDGGSGQLFDDSATEDFGDVTIGTGSSSTIVINGQGLQVDTLTISGTATFDNNGKNLTVSEDFSNSGIFDHGGGGTVTFDGSVSQAFTSNSDSFNNLTISSTSTVTLQDALDVDEALTISAGTFAYNNQNLTVKTLSIGIGGRVTKGTGTTTFDVTGGNWGDANSAANAQDIGNVVIAANITTTLDNPARFTNLTISNGATLDAATNDKAMSCRGDFTNSGTFNAGSLVTMSGITAQTLTSGGSSFDSLTINNTGATDTVTLQDTLDVNGTLTITDGTFVYNDQNIKLKTLSIASGAVVTKGTGTTTFDVDAGTWQDANATKQNIGNAIIGGGTTMATTLASNVHCDNMTISGSATLDVDSSNNYSITCSGNWSDSGTFNEQNGTVSFDGTSKTIAAETFYDLTIDTGATISTTGNVNCTNFTNSGSFTVATGTTFTPSASGSYTNNSIVVETGTGKVVFAASSIAITDTNGTEISSVTTDTDVFVTLTDLDENLDGGAADSCTGVTVTTSVDSEAITLTETGNATGIFRNASALAYQEYDGSATANDGVLEGMNGETLTASYTDSEDSSDNSASDTATGQTFTDSFTVTATTPQIAGSNFTVTITAKDGSGSTSEGYNGTVNLSLNYVSPTSGTQSLSVSSATSFSNGVKSVSLNYPDCGTITITATDSSDSSMTGTSGNIVFVPYDFSVSPNSTSQTVNKEFSLTITARNAGAATCANYKGTAALSVSTAACSTSGTISPSSLTSSYWSGGVATLTNAKFNKYGSITITATDATLTTRTGTSSSITFYPKDFYLSISDPPASRDFYYPDETFEISVTARDNGAATITNYNGTINISTSGISGLSSTYTFTCSDSGVHTFTGVYGASATTTANVTVTQSGKTSISGTLPSDITIKEATLKVTSKSAPVGKSAMTVAIYDSNDAIITEDDSTTFTVTLSESNDDSSASSDTTSTAQILTSGQATIYITDNQAETVTVTPALVSPSSATIGATAGTLSIGTLTGSGIGIEMWREIK